MEPDFDPEDKFSWFFGQLSRDDANATLNDGDSGVFLVRESRTQHGDFVLCVKEEERTSHYIINRVQVAEGISRFKIGDKEFGDMPSLLNFYKNHYLDTTTLIRPAARTRLLCKYDFAGRDPEDLPFKRGEQLEVIYQDEEEWWTARNSNGQVGQIPVKYTERLVRAPPTVNNSKGEYIQPEVRHIGDIQLPARARVITPRIPSAYDKTQLRLEVGDILTVTKMPMHGQWEGSINGRTGIFPFTHVEFL